MTTVITNTQVVELADPKLRALALRVVRELELTAERVAAHHGDRSRFRLPTQPDSVEALFDAQFRSLPQPTQALAAQRALTRLQAPAAVRARRLGDLTRIDLSVPVSVETQAMAIPLPAAARFSDADIAKLERLALGDLISGLTPQQPTNTLELRVHRVICVDETDGFLGTEAGEDEIYLGGTSVDGAGASLRIDPFKVGDFDDGDIKRYSPPRLFAAFPVIEGGFPKSFFATLVLSEADNGGLSKFIDDLLDKIRSKIATEIAKATGGAIGGAVGGALGGAIGGIAGAIIGAAVGYALGKAVDALRDAWEDDFFAPVTVSVALNSHDDRWPGGQTDSPQGRITWRGHGGKYELVYDWRLHDRQESIRYTAAWTQNTSGEYQIFDVPYEQYRARYDQLWPQGWRLHALSTAVVNRQPLYTAIWRPATTGETQVYGVDYATYRAHYDELWPQGWRLKLLTRYVVGGRTFYTAAWAPGTTGETQIYDADYPTYRARYDELWPQGWRLKLIDVVNVNGEPRYTAAWSPSTVGEFQIYGATLAQFQRRYGELWSAGWRLKFLSTYNLDGARITAVWRQTKEPEEWVHGWDFDDLKTRYDELWPQGWRLKVFDRFTV
ncbi:hypothetical protein FEK33_12530 [Nocardia asteroides NBRC 15531]|uniref:Uncharacterized protein n=1 Tax=Nocardia asteroides NBRC 15531 TaxID=1110697 RepID=U5EJH0_NOCAS|nr:hypothetical protein [Nocardia asteroides]TLF66851.1 hypothetical protein FEK33_12530 [Nocardia asteroides NBRC 15531]UGT51903.1 hypothetical protein LT345_15670 [Nocardia asteroides]SFN02814.1 hypothetical protein SAMN05444423_105411 [Nocardia asteroides]VEG35183.1 Uncharacterised protein [Nocardia asteroides]GAD85269.1 hypothetical protein NCAST_30_00390 [Nocardia asteroides NBRC 15531]